MKKALLLLMTAFFAGNVFAQTTYSYNFNNNLYESSTHGTALTSPCTGSFVKESLPIGVTKYVYHFGSGCGLTFNDTVTNFISSGSYTIEMYVRLDTTSGYKKLIDYNHLSSDNGFYNHDGQLALYPNFVGDSVVVTDGQYQYIALTRDASQNMNVFYNNQYQGSYNDAANDYIYDVYKRLVFFQDDSGTKSEETSGSVAMIHISNYAMDTTTLKNNYAHLSAMLNVPATTAQNVDINIYPNPAMDNMHVVTSGDCSFTISDITGKIVLNNYLQKGDNKLNLNNLSVGMYLLRVTDKNSGQSRVYKIAKE